MGKGQIISGGADGQYQVQIKYNRDRYTSMISDLNAKKIKLTEDRVPIQTEYDDKSLEVDNAVTELGQLIDELVDLFEDLEALQSQLAALRLDLTILEQELEDLINQEPPAWPEDIEAKRREISDKKIEISEKQTDISDKQKEISEKQKEIEEKQKEVNSLSFELAILGQKLAEIDLQITSIEKKVQYLEENMPADSTVSAWCADLTEDLTGNVGTIEIPGERIGNYGGLQIQPGYEDNAVYDQDRDGQLFPTIATTPAQAFYNAAMLPGWQKWKPNFRHGTITAITDSLANVTLDATVLSSQQDLAINQATTLSGVEFEYMSCDEAAFAVDDEVLVMFTGQDFANPKIIGFKTDPQGCCVYTEYWTDGTWDNEDHPADTPENDEYQEIVLTDPPPENILDEYYYKVTSPDFRWQWLNYQPDEEVDGVWDSDRLTLTVNVSYASIPDLEDGYVVTALWGKRQEDFSRGQIWFFHDRTENPPPFLSPSGREFVCVGDGVVDIDLSEEPYASILDGEITSIVAWVYKGEAHINYLKLC